MCLCVVEEEGQSATTAVYNKHVAVVPLHCLVSGGGGGSQKKKKRNVGVKD